MSIEADLFEMEKRFWTGDEGYYSSGLTADAVMVFPAPVGILDREATLASLRGAPRWADVRLTERHLLQLTAEVATLIYHAEARREGEAGTYRAYCSSTYVVRNRTWRMAIHQQTPVSG